LEKIYIAYKQFMQKTVRGEHSVRLKENRVLRKLCGRKVEEGGGGCRTLHNQELRELYPSLCYWGDRIKELERGGVLFGRPEGKGSLRRLRTEWEDRIEIDK
jgi:hypothetical protein